MSSSRIMTIRRIYGPERDCPLIRTSLWRSNAVVVVVVVVITITIIIITDVVVVVVVITIIVTIKTLMWGTPVA